MTPIVLGRRGQLQDAGFGLVGERPQRRLQCLPLISQPPSLPGRKTIVVFAVGDHRQLLKPLLFQ